jgi:predicted FMN-binding regulatory protein PaiB
MPAPAGIRARQNMAKRCQPELHHRYNARGQAQLIEDGQALQLVSRLSAQHEAGRERPGGRSEAPQDYIDTMLRAIVGFCAADPAP